MADVTIRGAGELTPIPTVGEAIAHELQEGVESDMLLATHRRALAGARHRLQRIQADFAQIARDAAGCSESEKGLLRLHVEGCREQLLQCYLTVNRQVASTPDGRERVQTLVDTLLSETLAQLGAPADPTVPSGRKKSVR